MVDGGMIAQALAVSHPAQVSRLILAATAAGTGKARPIPQPTVTAFRNPAKAVAALLPKNQAAAARAYLNAILQYPGLYTESAATYHSQYLAVQRWVAGQDQAGPLVRDIRVPTLVADGTRDQFIGTANARLLASSVPGAKLLLFDDAGHAFSSRTRRGSSGPSRPLPAEEPHKLRCAANPASPKLSHSRDDAEQGILRNPIAPGTHSMRGR
jgi:pimeloyl-ACP methyl ester carboxylesterase